LRVRLGEEDIGLLGTDPNNQVAVTAGRDRHLAADEEDEASEVVRKLVSSEGADATNLAIALTSSAVVLMPLLGLAKHRLRRRLSSGATTAKEPRTCSASPRR
jgi:hypothetical protein